MQPLSNAQLEQQCLQNPTCRQRLDLLKQGKLPLRPAATAPSPEEQQLKNLPPPAQPMSPPRSEWRSGPADWLFSWMYPFLPGVAEAQTAFSVYLTPQTTYVTTGTSSLVLYGNIQNAWGGHVLTPYFTTTFYPATEGKVFAYFSTTLPAQGQYLIDVTSSNALVKLRHQTDNPDVWDYRALPYGTYYHYVTVEPYAAGYHYWYFWAADGFAYIYSVTIRSYP